MTAYYRCSNCGYTMTEPRGRCPKCGVYLILRDAPPVSNQPQAIQKAECEHCGTPYKAFALVCEDCGAWINKASQIVGMTFFLAAALVVFGFMFFLISQDVNAKDIQQIVLIVGGFGLLMLLVFGLMLRAYRKAKRIHEQLWKK